MRFRQSENQIFRTDIILYVRFTTITRKQVIAETSNLILHICITCRCYVIFYFFFKFGQMFGSGDAEKKIAIIAANGRNFLLLHF